MNPNLVLVCHRQSVSFLSVVRHACGKAPEAKATETPSPLGSGDGAPANDFVSSTSYVTRDTSLRDVELVEAGAKDFAHAACKRRILAMRLPQEGREGTEEESEDRHFVLINSFVNLASECSVRATGALLK